MPVQDLFDGLAEIVDDVEAISYLDRLWGTTRRPLGVGCAPVSSHELDAGTSFKPARECGGRAIREQLDGSALLGIHEDRAVGVASTLTPVIHPKHARRTYLR
jgi:hypothetical protein